MDKNRIETLLIKKEGWWQPPSELLWAAEEWLKLGRKDKVGALLDRALSTELSAEHSVAFALLALKIEELELAKRFVGALPEKSDSNSELCLRARMFVLEGRTQEAKSCIEHAISFERKTSTLDEILTCCIEIGFEELAIQEAERLEVLLKNSSCSPRQAEQVTALWLQLGMRERAHGTLSFAEKHAHNVVELYLIAMLWLRLMEPKSAFRCMQEAESMASVWQEGSLIIAFWLDVDKKEKAVAHLGRLEEMVKEVQSWQDTVQQKSLVLELVLYWLKLGDFPRATSWLEHLEPLFDSTNDWLAFGLRCENEEIERYSFKRAQECAQSGADFIRCGDFALYPLLNVDVASLFYLDAEELAGDVEGSLEVAERWARLGNRENMVRSMKFAENLCERLRDPDLWQRCALQWSNLGDREAARYCDEQARVCTEAYG